MIHPLKTLIYEVFQTVCSLILKLQDDFVPTTLGCLCVAAVQEFALLMF